jgi:hypothetical protein
MPRLRPRTEDEQRLLQITPNESRGRNRQSPSRG